jgi:hypothetical protein
VAGSCECSDEPLGSIKGRTFLDQLRVYQLLINYETYDFHGSVDSCQSLLGYCTM